MRSTTSALGPSWCTYYKWCHARTRWGGRDGWIILTNADNWRWSRRGLEKWINNLCTLIGWPWEEDERMRAGWPWAMDGHENRMVRSTGWPTSLVRASFYFMATRWPTRGCTSSAIDSRHRMKTKPTHAWFTPPRVHTPTWHGSYITVRPVDWFYWLD